MNKDELRSETPAMPVVNLGIRFSNYEEYLRKYALWSQDCDLQMLTILNFAKLNTVVNDYLSKNPIPLIGKDQKGENKSILDLLLQSLSFNVTGKNELHIEAKLHGVIHYNEKEIPVADLIISAKINTSLLETEIQHNSGNIEIQVFLNTTKINWVGLNIEGLPDKQWIFDLILATFKLVLPKLRIYTYPLPESFKGQSLPLPNLKGISGSCDLDWGNVFWLMIDSNAQHHPYNGSMLAQGKAIRDKGMYGLFQISSDYLYTVTAFALNAALNEFKSPGQPMLELEKRNTQSQTIGTSWQYNIALLNNKEMHLKIPVDNGASSHDFFLSKFSFSFLQDADKRFCVLADVKGGLSSLSSVQLEVLAKVGFRLLDKPGGKQEIDLEIDLLDYKVEMAWYWFFIRGLLIDVATFIAKRIVLLCFSNFNEHIVLPSGLTDILKFESLGVVNIGDDVPANTTNWIGSYFIPGNK